LEERRRFADMAAEAMREMGILVIVFAPLYKVFEKSGASWSAVAMALVFGITALFGGMEYERRREI